MSSPAEQAQVYAAERAFLAADADLATAQERSRPSILLRPALFVDGDRWCALYGANLQDGLAAFGRSPAEAFAAFDAAWFETLPSAEGAHD
mgnify:CR=1 FL=1